MTDDPISVIPTAAEKVGEDFASFARLMKAMAEHAEEIAASRWKLYSAYLGAGFTKEEALTLCMKLGVS